MRILRIFVRFPYLAYFRLHILKFNIRMKVVFNHLKSFFFYVCYSIAFPLHYCISNFSQHFLIKFYIRNVFFHLSAKNMLQPIT